MHDMSWYVFVLLTQRGRCLSDGFDGEVFSAYNAPRNKSDSITHILFVKHDLQS